MEVAAGPWRYQLLSGRLSPPSRLEGCSGQASELNLQARVQRGQSPVILSTVSFHLVIASAVYIPNSVISMHAMCIISSNHCTDLWSRNYCHLYLLGDQGSETSSHWPMVTQLGSGQETEAAEMLSHSCKDPSQQTTELGPLTPKPKSWKLVARGTNQFGHQ